MPMVGVPLLLPNFLPKFAVCPHVHLSGIGSAAASDAHVIFDDVLHVLFVNIIICFFCRRDFVLMVSTSNSL